MIPLVLALALATAPAVTHPTIAASPESRALERELESGLSAQKVAGAAMVVIDEGRVVVLRGFGVTQSGGSPVGPRTLFRLGSTTKMFVAAAALTLVEEGRLDLHRPISAYVPDLGGRLGHLTMHQLLTHTAGLFDESPMSGPGDDAALARMVGSWGDEAVFLQPGRAFSYSNPGYWLAGHVIERVDGRPFAEAARARILEPLGMTRSTFRPDEAARHSLAAPHDGKGRVIRSQPNHAGTWPSGSLYSCAEDLSRFLQALLNDGVLEGRRVLPAAVVRGLLHPRVQVVEPAGHRYGYGTMHRTVEGESLVFHTGTRLGYGSYVDLVPGRRFAVAVLANRSGRMLRSWAGAAMTRFAGLSAKARPAAVKVTMSEAEFRPLLGTYENPPGLKYELFNSKLVPWTREGGQLFSRRGFMRMPVYRIGDNRFTDGQVTFTTEADEEGRPRYLYGEWHTLVRRPGRSGPRAMR